MMVIITFIYIKNEKIILDILDRYSKNNILAIDNLYIHKDRNK
jgi:hypothetical protein